MSADCPDCGIELLMNKNGEFFCGDWEGQHTFYDHIKNIINNQINEFYEKKK